MSMVARLLLLAVLALLLICVSGMPVGKSFGDVDALKDLLGQWCNSAAPFSYGSKREMKALDKDLLTSQKYLNFFRASRDLSCMSM
jgi:hypothetical protein